MKIAVLGSNGMLGSMLVDYLSRYHHVIATVRVPSKAIPMDNVEYRHLDVMGHFEHNLAFVVQDSDWIINAIGGIPQRVTNEKEFINVNAVFPAHLANYDRPIIHVTTDCVYTGSKGNYVESDWREEKYGYGYSKWLGEVKRERFYNIRCSLIGIEPLNHYSLLSWFLSQPIEAVIDGYVDHLWNGVTTLAFAKVCRGIIENKLDIPWRQHLVPDGGNSKYELLMMFRKYFNRLDITVNAITKGKNDRRLSTIHPEVNQKLWRMAGYDKPPTVEDMVKELAEYRSVNH
jgi:dTDP-4-dehydrorhamnose reductase